MNAVPGSGLVPNDIPRDSSKKGEKRRPLEHMRTCPFHLLSSIFNNESFLCIDQGVPVISSKYVKVCLFTSTKSKAANDQSSDVFTALM